MKKKTILLSTAFLPPAGWFSLLLNHPVSIEKHENYQRQTYRNRCLIYSEKGILPISVPVNRPYGNHTPITEVLIFNNEKWYLKQWRAIRSAYEASPFFLYYQDDLKPFFNGHHENLFQFNLELVLKICALLEISPDLHFTEKFEKTPEDKMDLRHFFSPKKPVQGHFPPYTQVFADRHGFIPNLSILDVLFNLGPEGKIYLSQIAGQF